MFPLLKHIAMSPHSLLALSGRLGRYCSTEASQKIHALVTGPPGIGKTTLVRKVCAELSEREKSVELRGFCMEEVREGYTWAGHRYTGPKIGFDVVTMSGQRGSLARVDVGGLHRFKFGKGTAKKRKKNRFVGKYRVLMRSFERVALPSLHIPIHPMQSGDTTQGKTQIYVIDEIGEMGLFSKPFATSVRALLRRGPQPPPKNKRIDPIVVMATFPVSGQTHKLLKEIKSREDCALFEVSEENRDKLVTEIADYLSQRVSSN